MRNLEFVQDTGNVAFHGTNTDVELLSDLPVGVSSGDQQSDLAFPDSQAGMHEDRGETALPVTRLRGASGDPLRPPVECVSTDVGQQFVSTLVFSGPM